MTTNQQLEMSAQWLALMPNIGRAYVRWPFSLPPFADGANGYDLALPNPINTARSLQPRVSTLPLPKYRHWHLASERINGTMQM